jgi:hypothetical protein
VHLLGGLNIFHIKNILKEVKCPNGITPNGWGLTKFCLLPNFKNMKKPKGKILFKPLLGAVCFHKTCYEAINLFSFSFFKGRKFLKN